MKGTYSGIWYQGTIWIFSIEWVWDIFNRPKFHHSLIHPTNLVSMLVSGLAVGYEEVRYTDLGACSGVMLPLPAQGSGWDICSVHHPGGRKCISTSLRCLNSKMCCYLSPGENSLPMNLMHPIWHAEFCERWILGLVKHITTPWGWSWSLSWLWCAQDSTWLPVCAT